MPHSFLCSQPFLRFFILALCIGCKDEGTPPLPPIPPRVPTVQVTLEEAGVTEVWLKLRLTDSAQPRGYEVRRNGIMVFKGLLGIQDTVLMDTTASPNHTYSYLAYRATDSIKVDSSAVLQLTTLDTTRHESYVWSVDTLGAIGGISQYLLDVAVERDSIWAVGYLRQLDSLGQLDPTRYNLARWNGQSWTYESVLFPICNANGNETNAGPFNGAAVRHLGSSNIWFACAVSFTRWSGTQYVRQCIVPSILLGGINALWGTSMELFAVGDNGTVITNRNGVWEPMNSGSNMRLTDVQGQISNNPVWACGYFSDLSRSTLLEYNGSVWRTVSETMGGGEYENDSLSGMMSSVWSPTGRDAFVAAGDVVYRVFPGSRGEARAWFPGFVVGFFKRIRGSARNNVFVVGQSGTLVHFNGMTWHRYSQFFSLSTAGDLLAVACTDNRIAAVGYTLNGRAIVIRGKK